MAIPTLVIGTPPDPLAGTVTITATVTGVDTVWFWIDGVNVKIDHTSPFNYSWDTTAVKDGAHYLVCKGFYANNKVITVKKTVMVGNATAPPPPPVCQDPPAIVTAPAITGTEKEGQTLTVSTGAWTNCDSTSGCSCTYTYQWERCDSGGANCVAISAATAKSYTLHTADVGGKIKCIVIAHNSAGPSLASTTVATGVIAALAVAVPSNTSVPTISGTPMQGSTLSCSTGAWTNSPTSYAYQWQRCNSSGASCVNISGATGPSYTLVLADVGSTIRCGVIASNVTGPSASVPTAVTGVVAAAPPTATGKPAIPANGCYFGSYVTFASTGGTSNSQIQQFETLVQRRLGIRHRYRGWSVSFPQTSDEGWDWSQGCYSMVSWSDSGYSGSLNILDSILNGVQDSVINARADAVKAWGHPIFIRLFWEMNLQKNAFSGNPTKYIAAWKKIYTAFQSRGAKNAAFVWCPDYYDDPQTTAQHWSNYYPGDGYVDWVGADGYNRSTSNWRNLMTILGQVYDAYPSKPFMVGETSCIEDPNDATRKATWITQARNDLKATHKNVKAWMWFHHPQGLNASYDWQVDTSQNALDAYIAAGADSYFNPTVS